MNQEIVQSYKKHLNKYIYKLVLLIMNDDFLKNSVYFKQNDETTDLLVVNEFNMCILTIVNIHKEYKIFKYKDYIMNLGLKTIQKKQTYKPIYTNDNAENIIIYIKNILMELNLNNPKVTRFKSKYFPFTVDKKNLDFNKFNIKNDEIVKDMQKNGTWYEDGINYDFKKATNKCIALGRMQYYIQFSDFLYEKYKKRFYLLDFMTRIDNNYGPKSLLYYIESAEEIHINLEGITYNDIYQATIGIGKLATHINEIKAKHTTAWEINQVFYKNLLDHTWFHTGSRLSKDEVFEAFGHKVSKNRILDDNKNIIEMIEESF